MADEFLFWSVQRQRGQGWQDDVLLPVDGSLFLDSRQMQVQTGWVNRKPTTFVLIPDGCVVLAIDYYMPLAGMALEGDAVLWIS
jgi:hypothetical protein